MSLLVACDKELVSRAEHAIVSLVGDLAEKGSISIAVSQELLDEALKSVEKHSAKHAPASSGTSDAEKGTQALRAQLENSQSKSQELMERLTQEHEAVVRVASDFDNYKKRVAKEREEQAKFGCERLARDLLAIVDNFDRALAEAQKGKDLASFEAGVRVTRKLLEETLKFHGVKSFSSVGQKFDPRIHEAMMQQETTEVEINTVLDEMAAGFWLHDRLLRPAMVVIAKAPSVSLSPDLKKP